MKLNKWSILLRTSETFARLAAVTKIAGNVAGLVKVYVGDIRENSLFDQNAVKIPTWLESIRQRLRAVLGEDTDRRWGKALEAGIILVIALMPVLNSWETLLGLTLLLGVIRFPERRLPETGLFIFWLALVVSAIMALGLGGLSRLVTATVWFLVAGLTGRVFTAAFSRKVMGFQLITGLLWMVIGLWQQAAGVLTPAGWLEQGQNLSISVRSYSVFGNPNIYGLYLLSILVFAFSGLNDSNRIYRGVSWIALAFAVISLGFTYSRTVWLLGLAALVFWFGKRLCCGKRLYLGLGILFLSLPGVMARLTGSINFSESTFWFRVEIWRKLLGIVADFPLWGAGPGSFTEVYGSYPTGSGLVQHGHQLYLQLWLESGLLSLAAFIRVIVKSLTGFTGLPSDGKAVALVVVLFLMAGFLETWWVHQFSGGYFWLMIGLLHSMRTGQIDS